MRVLMAQQIGAIQALAKQNEALTRKVLALTQRLDAVEKKGAEE